MSKKTIYARFGAKKKEKILKNWGGYTATALFFARKYKCSERSLWRWKAKYDNTMHSLQNKSSRPKTKHPKSHTEHETTIIKRHLHENPSWGLNELWGNIIADFNYKRSYFTMINFIRKNGLRQVLDHEKCIPKKYHTPKSFGQKWQMDVKYVPQFCYEGELLANGKNPKFYQFTMIDEATRQRFLFVYKNKTAKSTCDFVKRAITYFGYKPKKIQTDNGMEFTYAQGTHQHKACTKHEVDKLLENLQIKHKLIKAYTPRHNGKVERSHRTDQDRFYNFLKFKDIQELQTKLAKWLFRYNNTPHTALTNCQGKQTMPSPIQKREELTEMFKNEVNWVVA